MTNDLELMKAKLPDYLRGKGININKNFKCLTGTHKDKNPSMSYHREGNRVKCFSCDWSGDIIDLIGLAYSINDNKEKFKKAREVLGFAQNYPINEQYTHNKHNTDNKHNTHDQMNNIMTKENTAETTKTNDHITYFNKCHSQIVNNTYLQDRGISKETIDRFNIGYDKNYNGWEAIIIPTSSNSFIARNTDKQAESNDRYRKSTGEYKLFNSDILQGDEPVFIVEGEIDALSLIEAGGNAMALGGIQNKNVLKKELRRLQKVPPIILYGDNDTIGQNGIAELQKELDSIGILYYLYSVGEYKDANEMLVKDRSFFFSEIQNIIRDVKAIIETETKERLEKELLEYNKNNCGSYIDSFLEDIKDKAKTSAISTGFKELDEVLDGGLYEGLYIIGAMSSSGKTTFVLQIADQIAERGQDVLIFSLEMARYELMAKSFSRNTFLINGITTAKTTRQITNHDKWNTYNSEEIDVIVKSREKYRTYANHLYITEGMGDINVKSVKETVEKHIRITGNRPVVVIDYLQILAPNNVKATDKQNTDKAMLELKRLSRDCKLPLIGISSFNRDSYNEDASMKSFKESGAIEYSSDVLLGLQPKRNGKKTTDIDKEKVRGNENDARIPRELELIILKNRNGRKGDTLEFKYYTYFNYMEEKERRENR